MNHHEIAEQRSAANPSELIYVWYDGYNHVYLVADDYELQYNHVADCEIEAVYRDGEQID
jgi:hypothetical protein